MIASPRRLAEPNPRRSPVRFQRNAESGTFGVLEKQPSQLLPVHRAIARRQVSLQAPHLVTVPHDRRAVLQDELRHAEKLDGMQWDGRGHALSVEAPGR
jgi:hypothetical protein